MSDTKSCPACGTIIDVSDSFCYMCGAKQKAAPEPALFSADPPAEASLADAESADISLPDIPAVEASSAEAPKQATVNETKPDAMDKAQLKEEKIGAGVDMAKPSSEPTPAPAVPEIKPGPKSKKFPWFFTLFWIMMVIAVASWGYFLFFDARYDYPKFTEDAQRLVLFTAAVAVLIYTFSLKLTMRKLKAFPTVILVISALIIFYFFTIVELTDGDFLHELMTGITSRILTVSGQ